MNSLVIKQIDNHEIDIFLNILRDIALWLKDNDKEMWNINKLSKQEFILNNKNSDCYIGYLDNVPVATVILKEKDEFMWTNIRSDDSIFVNKLGVVRSYSGRGISNKMLDFVKNEAIRRQKRFIRLDCYADREYLCNLYTGYGFELVHKKEMLQGIHAALFELEI